MSKCANWQKHSWFLDQLQLLQVPHGAGMEAMRIEVSCISFLLSQGGCGSTTAEPGTFSYLFKVDTHGKLFFAGV